MEDKKGPGPKKKVIIRKSLEKREEPISPEKIKGDWKLNWTPEELAERKKGAGEERGVKYGSAGKKLTPLTPEEQAQSKKELGKIPEEKISSYVTGEDKLGYKGGVQSNSALQLIDKFSEIADKNKITSPGGIKSLLEGPARKKILEQVGLNENQFNILAGGGNEEKKQNLYYSILQQVNAKRKELDPLKATRSSFVVDKTEDVKTPESKKVVESKPDSAFIYVKDSKGNITKEKK